MKNLELPCNHVIGHTAFYTCQNKDYWRLAVNQTASTFLSELFTAGYTEINDINSQLQHVLLQDYLTRKSISAARTVSPSPALIMPILENGTLSRVIRLMFGLGYVIDDIFYFENSFASQGTAQWFHRDHCGHRWKIYYPIGLTGKTNHIDFITNTHKTDGLLRRWEMYRFDFDKANFSRSNPYRNKFSEILLSHFQQNGGQLKTLEVHKERITIFNTNLVHRTSPSHSNNLPNDLMVAHEVNDARIVLEIEMIDPISSRYISDNDLGPCGIGHYTGYNFKDINLELHATYGQCTQR
jgi:hypothetical protein